MATQAFVMQLKAGQEVEYQRRHDEIWPELSALLKRYGVADYSIHLQPQSLQLFALMQVPDNFDGEALKQEQVLQRWWQSMAPLMETLPSSNEPVGLPLTPMFYLP